MKASVDYGLRAVLYLAEKGTTCSSRDIAEDMSIPRDYLIQLAQLLRNAGIVDAHPGKYGGYYLAKDPADITVLEVLDALEGGSQRAARGRAGEDGSQEGAENVRRSCELIEASINAYLQSISIQVLLDCVRSGQGTNEFLSERFLEEGRRLADA